MSESGCLEASALMAHTAGRVIAGTTPDTTHQATTPVKNSYQRSSATPRCTGGIQLWCVATEARNSATKHGTSSAVAARRPSHWVNWCPSTSMPTKVR